MCEIYKSFDFSKLDNTSYFYGQLVNYYEHEVDKSKFPSLSSLLDFMRNCRNQTSRQKHNGHRITEFVGVRPKMYCLVDGKHVVHNAAKGVPCNVVIDGERMSVKNIECISLFLRQRGKGAHSSGIPSNASTTKDSISARRNKPRLSWHVLTTRDGFWTAMCIHSRSSIIVSRAYKGEDVIPANRRFAFTLVRTGYSWKWCRGSDTYKDWSIRTCHSQMNFAWAWNNAWFTLFTIDIMVNIGVFFYCSRVVMYWCGFERKFVSSRHTASREARIPWGCAVGLRFLCWWGWREGLAQLCAKMLAAFFVQIASIT